MKRLFVLDLKNYDELLPCKTRPSARAIIMRDGKAALIHSLKYDYYKFPGGGIEAGESHLQTLIREVREEAGLNIIPESVKEFGSVLRRQLSAEGENAFIFEQENFYYFCETDGSADAQQLDDYEQFERFTLEYIEPQAAIAVNREHDHQGKDPVLIEREARVLELLI